MKKRVVIYDFDGTIYNGDSTIDFFKFCLLKYKTNLFLLPYILIFFLLWKFKLVTTEKFKEFFLLIINKKNIEKDLKEFKNLNKNKIFPSIFKNLKEDKKSTDVLVVISASPEFILKAFLNDIKEIDLLMGTKFCNGKIETNCKGKEKVRRLKKYFGKNIEILKMYSDSIDDKPLYSLAKNCYMVSKGKITNINKEIKNGRF
jgi:phosphatidylglycerophosphatase C